MSSEEDEETPQVGRPVKYKTLEEKKNASREYNSTYYRKRTKKKTELCKICRKRYTLATYYYHLRTKKHIKRENILNKI